MFSDVFSPVEKIPEFRPLVFGVPLSEFIPVRKEPFLCAGFFLIAPAARVGKFMSTAATGSSASVLLDTSGWWPGVNFTNYYLFMTSGGNSGRFRKITVLIPY